MVSCRTVRSLVACGHASYLLEEMKKIRDGEGGGEREVDRGGKGGRELALRLDCLFNISVK